MKSIKSKILVSSISLLVVSLIMVGSVAGFMNYSSTIASLEQTMTEAVAIAANQIEAHINGYKMVIRQLAANPVLALEYEGENIAYVDNEFKTMMKMYSFTSVMRTNSEGIVVGSTTDISDREYFKMAKTTNEPYVSDPIIRTDDGTMNIFISAPIMKNGVFDGVVFAGVDAMFLCNIVTDINIGNTGNSWIIDKTGNTIAHKNVDMVINVSNTQNDIKTDKRLEELAKIERDMMAGKTGFDSYSFDGVDKFMAFAPIPNSNGWSVTVAVVQNEFLASTISSILITVGIAFIFIIVSIIIQIKTSISIANPIKRCVERITLLSKGDIHTVVPVVNANDETGVLANSTKIVVEQLAGVVNDLTYTLGELSNGNLDIEITKQYEGDFIPIQHAILNIISSLNGAMSQINQSSNQVSAGADQISAAAQALAQGATEQASSIEELSASITDISEQVKDNADNASKAHRLASESSNTVITGNEQMKRMIVAMNDINEKSNQISKIVKTIEDIAFKTNILALNAAVEAARAGGSAGKGFAVVATEVRTLSSQSAEAAKGTTELIQASILAVENGMKIANETARELSLVVESVESTAGVIAMISKATNEQAVALSQVSIGVNQISAVVQTNSATSEETSASSQELFGQSQLLQNLVQKFKIKDK